jgi:hypothetical protein
LDHKFTISDEQMISQILYNITPPMYQMTVAIIKRDLQRKITITLPELQADLRHLYSQHELLKGNSFTPRINGSQGRGRGDNATMLAVYPTQVKSNCNLCGKRGHKSVDCWDHPRNINKRPGSYKGPRNESPGKAKATSMVEKAKLVCTYCHKQDHLEANCFKKKAMEKNKEENITSNSPDSEKTAVLLIASCNYCNEFRTSDSVVKMNHNTFIGDSGATCHMRYSKTGMFDLVDFRTEVTVGNNDTIFSVS